MDNQALEIKNLIFYKKLTSLPFIEKILLFGSRARKDNRPRADIDLAIYCPNASFEDWDTIQKIIETADTLLKIDCIRLDELKNSSEIKQAILKQGIKLYEKS